MIYDILFLFSFLVSAIPESQKIYVSTLLNISFSFVRWNDLNTPDKVREAVSDIYNIYSSSYTFGL